MMLTGIKQVAPTGILLMFAVLYFATMLDAGLFDPVIAFILNPAKNPKSKGTKTNAVMTETRLVIINIKKIAMVAKPKIDSI